MLFKYTAVDKMRKEHYDDFVEADSIELATLKVFQNGLIPTEIIEVSKNDKINRNLYKLLKLKNKLQNKETKVEKPSFKYNIDYNYIIFILIIIIFLLCVIK